jgi:signal transduction histidine kinase
MKMNKTFQPFFITKPTGQARPNGSSGRRTGQGLSLRYDIVKAHGGDPCYREKVNTKEAEFTEFVIQLRVYG